MGMVKGLPVGLSLIGTAWTDRSLLALGASVERVLGPVPGPQYIAHSAQGMAAR
jgi:amidase